MLRDFGRAIWVALLGLVGLLLKAKTDSVAANAKAAGVADTERRVIAASASRTQAAELAAERAAARAGMELARAGAAPNSVRPDLDLGDPFDRD